jgi:hypothetical protein
MRLILARGTPGPLLPVKTIALCALPGLVFLDEKKKG